MEDNNIILLKDLSEFTMIRKPTKEELEKIFSCGFTLLIAEVGTINDTYYVFRRY